ncbi:peptide ABC transporter permease [Haloferula helveola]|uniref:Peptide ABC transporter permease n=1 Tax=Haloferula helveola TaxID=490095 RepID=A0ABM7RA91_9BACT|nr:peptide ABC transporter permease [Haloferula helveola]
MTFPRKIGLLLALVAIAATAAHFCGLELPSLRWFYSFDGDPNKANDSWFEMWRAEIFGITFSSLLLIAGMLLLAFGGGFQWNPLTLRRMERFRSIGRGYVSFRILIVLLVLAMLDQLLVGKRALAVRYQGEWHFPAFVDHRYPAHFFGAEGEEETNYRELKERLSDTDAVVILAPVPWDPTFDSDDEMELSLPIIDGLISRPDGKTAYNGYAYQHQKDDPTKVMRSGRVREGRLRWDVEVFDVDGDPVGREKWEDGRLVETTVPDNAELAEEGGWVRRIYPPLPPSLQRKHFLGTDKKGWDIAAQLYGGLQVIFKAAIIYLALTYGIGITFGCLMGYFGGVYDLVMQRIMEVMSNVPFLLVVMIICNNIGRDNITLGTILLVFCIFSWIQIAVYLRTSTYKEKARDYASAAKVLGAGTGRVIFRHILPNAISTIVTLVPFSVSSVIAALTALDFLGFGVPDSYPSWGRVLNDGVENLGSPWIVSSVFAIMVTLLLLITFVGEAIREAFDPKKFTTYQ